MDFEVTIDGDPSVGSMNDALARLETEVPLLGTAELVVIYDDDRCFEATVARYADGWLLTAPVELDTVPALLAFQALLAMRPSLRP